MASLERPPAVGRCPFQLVLPRRSKFGSHSGCGQVLDHRLNFVCAAAYRPSFRKLSASTPTRRDPATPSHCNGTTLTIGASRSSTGGVCRRSVASSLAADAPTATLVAPLSLMAPATSPVLA